MTMESDRPTCFIAMPISMDDPHVKTYTDPQHWAHVMEYLFVPAIKKAGYKPIPPAAQGTSMIHARIVEHLVESDLVLVDLSQHNPNVLFELGVRTSVDRPVVLVKDEHLRLPFDINGLNTHQYASGIERWVLDDEIARLAQHITATKTASGETNPLWARFGIAITAEAPMSAGDPSDARLQLILERLERIEMSPRAQIQQVMTSLADRRIQVFAVLNSMPGVTNVSIAGPGNELVIATVQSDHEWQITRTLAAEHVVRAHGFQGILDHFNESEIRLHVVWETAQITY